MYDELVQSAEFEEAYMHGLGLLAATRTLTPEQIAYMQSVGNPKARATVYGQPPRAGLFRAFTGAVGPVQKRCKKNGGIWDGPKGKKFCIMSTGLAPVPVLPMPAPIPPPAPLPPAPLPPAPLPPVLAPGPAPDIYPTIACGPGTHLTSSGCVPDVIAPPASQPPTYPEPYDPPQQRPQPPGTGGGGGGLFQPFPEFDSGGAGFDYGNSGIIPEGGGFETNFGPGGAGGGAAPATPALTECSPGFNQTLPKSYADRYGMMNVVAVYCGNLGGGGTGGAGASEPIELSEILAAGGGEGLFGMGSVRNLG